MLTWRRTISHRKIGQSSTPKILEATSVATVTMAQNINENSIHLLTIIKAAITPLSKISEHQSKAKIKPNRINLRTVRYSIKLHWATCFTQGILSLRVRMPRAWIKVCKSTRILSQAFSIWLQVTFQSRRRTLQIDRVSVKSVLAKLRSTSAKSLPH